ncbi:MAG: phosphate acyltransferase PlsX [Clostridiales bacterium]
MRFAIDIMGGDNAPQEIIDGVLLAAAKYPERQYIMVGKNEVLQNLGKLPANISTVSAASVMAMEESVENLMSKKDSSIWVATKLVKDKAADAIISAGSTGAQMAAALLLLGRIKGINRPAILGILPTARGKKLFLDMGANSVCTADMLYQFAVMGDIYGRLFLDMEKPQIALLSNGTEAGKGNELTQAAYQLLADSDLNFIGNKEGRDLPEGNYDVLVTDGFTGNVALKTLEGTVKMILDLLKDELTSGLTRKMGAALIKPGLMNIKKKMDHSEQGGAPLLGVKGLSIICHGSSQAKAIANALDVAANCLQRDFIGQIKQAMGIESDKIIDKIVDND